METGYRENLANGLSALVDWMSFTFTELNNPDQVIKLLGFRIDDFNDMEKGRYGYQKGYKCTWCNLTVLYSGQPGMGVHVDISGSAILAVLEKYHESSMAAVPFGDVGMEVQNFGDTVLADFLKTIFGSGGKFSRMDLAVDDISSNFFSARDVLNLVRNDQYSTRLRAGRIEEGFGSEYGLTIYFGSRKSDLMIRVYDKAAERDAKKKAILSEACTRWELELKNEYADKVAAMLSDGQLIGTVATGIFANYLRFIELDATRKSRCSTIDTWLDFLASASKLSLWQKGSPATIESSIGWVKHQCAPTFAMICFAMDGDLGFLTELLNDGRGRMTKKHYDMIAAFKAAYNSLKEVA